MKTKVIEIHQQFPELDKIAQCAKVIRQGGLVLFPTETVYGIAADFNNLKAIKRLREVKRRTHDKPFSVLISQKALIDNYTPATDPMVYKLVDRFWPGPLTVIVPSREENSTIGVRMPHNTIALYLVRESQCTVAAPSANFEGNPPPSTCQEALRDLDGLVDIAIEGGSAKIGLASSVVDFTQGKPTVLREGVISQADVDETVNKKTILFVCTGNSCRSVMAEYLLKDRLKDRPDVNVFSAGTGVFLMSTASRETLVVLNKKSIDATHHQSQAVTSILVKKSDLILVMTRAHRQQVLERVPSVEKRIYLLKEFADTHKGESPVMDIPDPIGKSAEAYEECMLVIEEAVDKLVSLI